MNQSLKKDIERAIAQHERHKNCYFWQPFGRAGQRRQTEKDNTWFMEFSHLGHDYKYESDVRCSCKNYYYTGTFLKDGKKVTVRTFKNLIK